MVTVECNTLFNQKKLVPVEDLIFRPSIYGLIKNEGKVLLIRTSATGRLEFPGGGIELGEGMKEALKRECIEEAGVEVEVGDFLFFKENFFYHDPSDQAYHSLLFVYQCTPLGDTVSKPHLDIDGKETEEPLWIDSATLDEKDFAGSDRDFFTYLREEGLL